MVRQPRRAGRPDPGSRSANFRTLVGPRGRGRGLGSEAVRLVVAYALGEGGLHRLDLEVYAFNPRARRVYEKAGFVLEGTRREAVHVAVHRMAYGEPGRAGGQPFIPDQSLSLEVLLDRDPFDAPAEVGAARVERVWIGGEVVAGP